MAARQQPKGSGLGVQYEDLVPKSEWKVQPEATILTIDLPGFAKEQIKVTYVHTSRVIRVTGERPLADRRWSRFNEVFTVPQNCLVDKIHGSFKNNSLTITMPKETITKTSSLPESSKTVAEKVEKIEEKRLLEESKRKEREEEAEKKKKLLEEKEGILRKLQEEAKAKEMAEARKLQEEAKAKEMAEARKLQEEAKAKEIAETVEKLWEKRLLEESRRKEREEEAEKKKKKLLDEKEGILRNLQVEAKEKEMAEARKLQEEVKAKEMAEARKLQEESEARKLQEEAKAKQKLVEEATLKKKIQEKKSVDESLGKEKMLKPEERKLPEVDYTKLNPGSVTKAVSEGASKVVKSAEEKLGYLVEKESNIRKGIMEKIRGRDVTGEDKKLMVNVGVAALVIFALGAYVSYTFCSSSSSSSSSASSSSPSTKPE